MARKARTVPLKILRFSLDPLEPVESRILRRIEEIGQELRSTIDFEMTQEEVDRFALKRLLADALVYEASGARSAFTAAGHPPAAVPVSAVAPSVAALAAPVVAQPAPVVQPVEQEPIVAAAPAVPVVQPPPAEAVQDQPEPVRQELPQPVEQGAGQTVQPAAQAPVSQAPAGSWQEQLISESSAKPAGQVSTLLQGLSWPGEDD